MELHLNFWINLANQLTLFPKEDKTGTPGQLLEHCAFWPSQCSSCIFAVTPAVSGEDTPVYQWNWTHWPGGNLYLLLLPGSLHTRLLGSQHPHIFISPWTLPFPLYPLHWGKATGTFTPQEDWATSGTLTALGKFIPRLFSENEVMDTLCIGALSCCG